MANKQEDVPRRRNARRGQSRGGGNARERRNANRRNKQNAYYQEPEQLSENDTPVDKFKEAAKPIEKPQQGILSIGNPNERDIFHFEFMYQDHHGFFSLVDQVYNDIIQQDSRNMRSLCLDEFRLCMYWYLIRVTLISANGQPLNQFQTLLLNYLTHALPDDISFPVEIVRYFEEVGSTETVTGVRVHVGIHDHLFIKHVDINKDCTNIEYIESRYRHNFASPTLFARRLDAIWDPTVQALQQVTREWTMPGSRYQDVHRDRAATLKERRHLVFETDPSFHHYYVQFNPFTLADAHSFLASIAVQRNVSKYEFTTAQRSGSMAQFVVSKPIQISSNQLETGSDYDACQRIELRAAQLGMIHRHLRMCPKSLTFRNSTQDVNLLYAETTEMLRMVTVNERRVGVLISMLTEYVTSGRR
jgi:hypothetical protein